MNTVDARGYSCPEPLIMTRAALEKPVQKPVEPLVDELDAIAYRNAHGIK